MTKKIGALWKPKSPNDTLEYFGEIEIIQGMPQKIAVFKNTKKTKDNQPDFNIVLSDGPKNQSQTN